MNSENKYITMGAAKHLMKMYAAFKKENGFILDKTPTQLVEENDFWLADEWTHLGHCIVTCLKQDKLLATYKNGKHNAFDSLIGITIKSANMTVDPVFLKDVMKYTIETYFP